MTAQRRVVAEVLNGEHVHLTADEVHARAVAKLPEISRATVYNTLGELVSLGEVLEVTTDKRAKRYDPNAHRPHHHLVCARCGAIRDVHPSGNPLADLPDSERFGFTVSDVEVTYRGAMPELRERVAHRFLPWSPGIRRGSSRMRAGRGRRHAPRKHRGPEPISGFRPSAFSSGDRI